MTGRLITDTGGIDKIADDYQTIYTPHVPWQMLETYHEIFKGPYPMPRPDASGWQVWVHE